MDFVVGDPITVGAISVVAVLVSRPTVRSRMVAALRAGVRFLRGLIALCGQLERSDSEPPPPCVEGEIRE